jgi:hypothetical protein
MNNGISGGASSAENHYSNNQPPKLSGSGISQASTTPESLCF